MEINFYIKENIHWNKCLQYQNIFNKHPPHSVGQHPEPYQVDKRTHRCFECALCWLPEPSWDLLVRVRPFSNNYHQRQRHRNHHHHHHCDNLSGMMNGRRNCIVSWPESRISGNFAARTSWNSSKPSHQGEVNRPWGPCRPQWRPWGAGRPWGKHQRYHHHARNHHHHDAHQHQ